jgi:hypothetical protein
MRPQEPRAELIRELAAQVSRNGCRRGVQNLPVLSSCMRRQIGIPCRYLTDIISPRIEKALTVAPYPAIKHGTAFEDDFRKSSALPRCTI